MHASEVGTELLESDHEASVATFPSLAGARARAWGEPRGDRPAAVRPDLGVEGFIDVHPIVLAVGQGVGAPLPDEAGGWVGVDSTAQEHRLLLVEVASDVAYRLVHRQHGLV